MNLKNWLALAAGAVALGLVAEPAHAVSPGGPLSTLNATGSQSRSVHEVHWYGRRYGYRYGYRPHYYYGPRYRYGYRYYRPGFRFYYGPRYYGRHYRRW